MKKQALIIGVVTIILSSLALSTTIHDGWHNPGDDFAVGSDSYYLIHDFGDDKVLLSINNRSVIINLGNCVEKDLLQYCFTELDEDINGERVKFSGGKAYASARITVESVGPDPQVTRSASKTSLDKEETTRISLRISNSGNRAMEKFYYEEIFPEELKVIGGDLNTNKYTMKGILQPGQSRNAEFIIKALEFVDYASQGKLNYSYEGKQYTESSPTITLSVKPPYDLDTDLDTDSLYVGEDLIHDLELENEGDEDMEVTFLRITVEGMVPSAVDDKMNTSKNLLAWKGFIDASDSISFKNKFEAKTTGNYNIRVEGTVKIEEKSYDVLQEDEVLIRIEKATPSIDIKPKTLTSGSQVKVKTYLENEALVKLELRESSLQVFDTTKKAVSEFIQKGEKDRIFEEVFTAPEIAKKKSYPVVFRGKYTTPSGESFDFEQQDEITVNPRSGYLSLDVESTPSVLEGNEAEIKVTVKNLMRREITVQANDQIPEGVETIGETSTEMQIPAQSELEAYSYKIKIPLGFEENEVRTQTVATMIPENIKAEANAIVNVEKLPEPEPEPEPIIEPLRKEEGFFTKLARSIKSIFSWVLS